MTRKQWAVLLTGAVLLVGIIAGPALAPRECERQTARRVASFYLGGAPFVVPDRDPDVGSSGGYSASHASGIFRQVKARIVGPPAPGGAPLAIAFISPSRARWGVVIEVPWGYWIGPLNGLGGVRRYIALFGFAIPIGEEYEWAS
jgi:hypothetical protein